MNAQELALALNHRGRKGRRFTREKDVSEVKCHSEMWTVDFFDGQQRHREVREQAERARLARLIFDTDLDAGVVFGNLPDGVDFRFPNGFVVHLKWVLPTVLSQTNGQYVP